MIRTKCETFDDIKSLTELFLNKSQWGGSVGVCYQANYAGVECIFHDEFFQDNPWISICSAPITESLEGKLI